MGEKAVSAPSDVAFPEEGVSFRSLLLFFSSIPTEEQNRFSTASHSRSAHRPLLNTLFHPSRTSERNRISQSVATHDCTRETILGGAVATGVPHPQWATVILLARSSRVARHDGAPLHLARRLPTRCLRGMAAEAPCPVKPVGQFPKIQWSKMQSRTLCWAFGTRREGGGE